MMASLKGTNDVTGCEQSEERYQQLVWREVRVLMLGCGELVLEVKVYDCCES